MPDREAKKPGRPPIFTAQRHVKHEIHLNMGFDVWKAIGEYCEAIGELSISLAVRRLIRERLTELGYLKERASSSSTKHA